MILECPNCRPYKFQDEEYGPKRRVHNLAVGPNKQQLWRCTVCGAERAAGAKTEKRKEG